MSYDPTNWQTGDVVTSQKLNKLEQGVADAGGGGLLIVNMTMTGDAMTLDKTWQEIYDAVPAVMVVDPTENDKSVYMVYEVFVDDGYHVDIGHGSVSFPSFFTDSPTGYPSSGDVP